MQNDSRAHTLSHPWELVATSLRAQQPECEANHSPTTSNEVNNLHYLYFYYYPACLLVTFFWLVSIHHYCFDPNHKWIIADKKGGLQDVSKAVRMNSLHSFFLAHDVVFAQ